MNTVIMNTDATIKVPSFYGEISNLFCEGGDQHHWGHFPSLLKSIDEVVDIPEMTVNRYVTEERMSRFQIWDAIGAEKSLCFRNKVEALRALATTLTDEYKELEGAVVYYLDEYRRINYITSEWGHGDEEPVKWYCYTFCAGNSHYPSAGSCVLYPQN